MEEISEAHKNYEIRKQWFIDRIGKKIYRNKTTCDCAICESVYKNGLTVSDEMHADYVHECESIYNYEGTPLKYFDTIQERDVFEQGLKKEASSK